MTAFAPALSASLLHFVWQGLLVAALLWTALFLLRKRSANIRYLISCAALAALAVLPAVTAFVLYHPAVAAPADPRPPAAVTAAAVGEFFAAGSSTAAWLVWLQSWALPVWSAGVLLFSIRLVWGCREVAALRRRGEPAESTVLSKVAAIGSRLGLARPVRILITSVADGPSVVGWIRPVILLPSATLLGLTAEQLDAVLAHELAHVRRYDYLVNILQITIETLLFYHPAVWWTSARIRHERELCCDDLAVSSCGDAVCYARALTKLERLRAMTPSLAMGSTGGSLMYRVERLLGAGSREYGPSKLSGIVALSLGLACFGLNLHWARGQSQERPGTVRLQTSITRDGAGVTVDLGGSSILHRTSVEYPGSAIEKGIQGSVTVEATLDAAGNVSDARVVSGPAELRKVALQSVLQWHFAPEAAGTARQVTIAFQLEGARNQEAESRRNRVGYAEAERKEAAQKQEPGQEGEAQARERISRETTSSIEAQIEELRARRAQTVQGQQNSGVLDTLKFRMAELESKLAAARRGDLPTGIAGSSLSSIEVVGLPDAMRDQLLSRIPVHLGDTLSPESLERIGRELRSFDEHLEVSVTRQGDAVSLRIAAPETRSFVTIRRN